MIPPGWSSFSLNDAKLADAGRLDVGVGSVSGTPNRVSAEGVSDDDEGIRKRAPTMSVNGAKMMRVRYREYHRETIRSDTL